MLSPMSATASFLFNKILQVKVAFLHLFNDIIYWDSANKLFTKLKQRSRFDFVLIA